jgi:hypothetical protein
MQNTMYGSRSHSNAGGVDVASAIGDGANGSGGLFLEVLLVLPAWEKRYLLTVEERNWR